MNLNDVGEKEVLMKISDRIKERNNEEIIDRSVFENIDKLMISQVNKIKGKEYTSMVQVKDEEDLKFIKNFMCNYFLKIIRKDFNEAKTGVDVFMKVVKYMDKIGV